MKRRTAFTLIEVLVALVVTALVVSLAYGATRAGFDVDDRIAAVRTGSQAEAAARALIGDAIRFALPGVRGGEPVFMLDDRTSKDGIPSDHLRFFTRGITDPLGTGDAWVVDIAAESGAVHLIAAPASQGSAAITGRVHAHGIDVRVLSHGSEAPWRDVWDESSLAPRAVSITFVGPDGRALSAPLVMRVAGGEL